MADPQGPPDPPSGPAGANPDAAEPADVTATLGHLAEGRPQAFMGLVAALVGAVTPVHRRRRTLSDQMIRDALAFDAKQADYAYRTGLVRSSLAFAALVVLSALVVIIVFLVRDHVELVKVVFAGVALIVSHAAAGASGYVAGRARKRSSE